MSSQRRKLAQSTASQHLDNMSENTELKFCEELFSRYEKCHKYLIPKEKCFQMTEDIRKACEMKKH